MAVTVTCLEVPAGWHMPPPVIAAVAGRTSTTPIMDYQRPGGSLLSARGPSSLPASAAHWQIDAEDPGGHRKGPRGRQGQHAFPCPLQRRASLMYCTNAPSAANGIARAWKERCNWAAAWSRGTAGGHKPEVGGEW